VKRALRVFLAHLVRVRDILIANDDIDRSCDICSQNAPLIVSNAMMDQLGQVHAFPQRPRTLHPLATA